MGKSRKRKSAPKKASATKKLPKRGPRAPPKVRKEVSPKAKKEVPPKAKKEVPRPNDSEEDVDCSICLDTTRYKKMKTLDCRHSFHEKCVNKCTQRSPFCPLCRTPLPQEDLSHDPLQNIMRHMLMFTFQSFDPFELNGNR